MKNTLIAILAGLVGALVLDRFDHECPGCSHNAQTYWMSSAPATTTMLGADPWLS